MKKNAVLTDCFSKLEGELRLEKKKIRMSSHKAGSTDSVPALLNQHELG